MRKNINKKQSANWWLIGALAIVLLLLYLFNSGGNVFTKASSADFNIEINGATVPYNGTSVSDFTISRSDTMFSLRIDAPPENVGCLLTRYPNEDGSPASPTPIDIPYDNPYFVLGKTVAIGVRCSGVFPAGGVREVHFVFSDENNGGGSSEGRAKEILKGLNPDLSVSHENSVFLSAASRFGDLDLGTRFDPAKFSIREGEPVMLAIPVHVQTRAKAGQVNLELYHSFNGGAPKPISSSEGVEFYENGELKGEKGMPYNFTKKLNSAYVQGMFSTTGRFVNKGEVASNNQWLVGTTLRFKTGSHKLSLYNAGRGKFVGDITPIFGVGVCVPVGLGGDRSGSLGDTVDVFFSSHETGVADDGPINAGDYDKRSVINVAIDNSRDFDRCGVAVDSNGSFLSSEEPVFHLDDKMYADFMTTFYDERPDVDLLTGYKIGMRTGAGDYPDGVFYPLSPAFELSDIYDFRQQAKAKGYDAGKITVSVSCQKSDFIVADKLEFVLGK